MIYQTLIEAIDGLQRTRLVAVVRSKGRLQLPPYPPTHASGLYWIYTNYSENELQTATPSPKRGAIDFAAACRRNSNVQQPCTVTVEGFRLVYSGIGGVGPSGGGGLRERILQEFGGGGDGMGTLAISGSSLSDLRRWRVSHVLWSELQCQVRYDYMPFAPALEGLWRLHYGWPILCSH